MWMLLLAACSSDSRIALLEIELPRAEHAVSVPLQAFLVPQPDARCDPSSSRLAVLELAPDALVLAGAPLEGSPVDGVLPDGALRRFPRDSKHDRPDRRDGLVAAVADGLSALFAAGEAGAAAGCTPWMPEGGSSAAGPRRVLVRIDARTPWSTVEDVLWTVQQAQPDAAYLAVEDPAVEPAVVTGLPQPVGPEIGVVRGAEDPRIRLDGAEVEVEIDALASTLRGKPGSVVLAPASGLTLQGAVDVLDALEGREPPAFLRVSTRRVVPEPVAAHSATADESPTDARVAVLPLRVASEFEACAPLSSEAYDAVRASTQQSFEAALAAQGLEPTQALPVSEGPVRPGRESEFTRPRRGHVEWKVHLGTKVAGPEFVKDAAGALYVLERVPKVIEALDDLRCECPPLPPGMPPRDPPSHPGGETVYRVDGVKRVEYGVEDVNVVYRPQRPCPGPPA